MLKVYSCIAQDHDPRLLIAALAICLFAQLTAFVLAGDVRRLIAAPPLRWVAMLALVITSGTWATHFVAMLAYQPHLPSAYSPYLTALSFVVGVAFTCGSFMCRSRDLGTLMTTAGIASMHLIGMSALETVGRLEYDWTVVMASILTGGLLVKAAGWWFMRSSARVPLVPSLLFTLAVFAIHLGSMSAITIVPDPRVVIPSGAISAQSLAIVVTTLVTAGLLVSFATLRFENRLAINAVEEATRLKLFADKAMEGLAVLDGDDIVDANDMFWDMSGHGRRERREHLRAADVIPEFANGTGDHGTTFFETIMNRPGLPPLEIEAAISRTTMSGAPRTLLVIRDITDRKATAAKIAHLANHDPLTGVGNRLTFNRVMEERLAVAGANEPLGLLCIDLDRFKPVNDLYGHLAGDAVLIEVTQRIAALLRKKEVLARLGGDEFAILIHRDPAGSSRLAQQIIAALSAPFQIDGQMISINCSIGIAFAPTDAGDAQALYAKADLALYRAKSDGRGRSCFFDRGMDDHVVETLRMKAELRTALQKDQLRLHYQPLMSLASNEIIGFEALLRWSHPDLGDVSPATFIPLAEETGLIVPIGEWVLREACHEAASWPNDLKIAVNLSPVQFTAGSIVEIVASAVSHSGLDPTRLDLEITEGVLVKDADGALRILHALKALGVRISMDDFGTGYSSLSYFRQFPFDKVKIDQGFVQDMEDNPQSRAIIRAIVGLAKGLDIVILAEGVETKTQIDMLKRKGCQEIQGFAISRPAPIGQFAAVVGARDDAGDRKVA